MPLVVIHERGVESAEDGYYVGVRVASIVIAFERLNERLGRSVGLRAADGC